MSTDTLQVHRDRVYWQAFKTTAFSQVFRIASLALSLISVPLFLKWLGQERYGLMLTGSALMGYLMFSSGGLSWASMILISQAHGKRDREAIQSIVRNSLTLSFCSVFIVFMMVGTFYALITSDFPFQFLPNHPEMPGLLFGLGTAATVSLMISPIYNVFSGLQEMSTVAIYQGVGTLLNAIILLTVAYFGLSLGWMFLIATLGSATCACVAVVHCVYRHSWVFRWGKIWEKDQINAQWRSGAKCLLMQVGVVLTATAPVLAISSSIGPEWVPYFTIPSTILNVPLGVFLQLNGNLQPAYGQAIGRGDTEWISRTVTAMARRVLALLGFIGICFVILSPSFIRSWTNSRIDVSYLMLIGVFLNGSIYVLAAVYRTMLSGVNRHSSAAFGDIFCGIVAVTFMPFIVGVFGVDMTGYAAFFCMLVTLSWLFPIQFRKVVGYSHDIQSESFFFIRLTITCIVTAFFAIPISLATKQFGSLPELAITSLATSFVYIAAGCVLGMNECNLILVRVKEGWNRFFTATS